MDKSLVATLTKRYYVYALLDNDVAFYIGKGTGDRMYAHEYDAKHSFSWPVHQRIRDIWAKGCTVAYRVLFQTDDEQEAYAKERETIESLGLANITNTKPGGDGGWGGTARLPLQAPPNSVLSDVRELRGMIGDLLAKARSGWVIYITRFRKPIVVMISVEEYERLKKAAGEATSLKPPR